MRHATRFASALLFLAACGADVSGPEPAQQTLSQRLAEGTTLGATLQGARVVMRGDYGGDGVPAGLSELTLERATLGIGITAAGDVGIDALDLELGDIDVRAGEVPIGIRSIRVRQSQPVVGGSCWTLDQDHVLAEVEVTLLLDWALDVHGTALPLGQQRVEGVRVTVEASQLADGRVRADVHLARGGVFWSWAGLLSLSDLEVTLPMIEGTPLL